MEDLAESPGHDQNGIAPGSEAAGNRIAIYTGFRMKLFLDTANLDELRSAAKWGIVDGVTTNPSLIAKEGKPIKDQIAAICDIVDGPVSAEVVAVEAKAMIAEGRELAKIHKSVVVKVPLI